MKKILLSCGVIGSFLLYVFFQQGNQEIQINLPLVTTTPLPPAPRPTTLGKYRDGTYTGSVADAFYGPLQVQAVISGGRLVDVIFVQYPSDRSTSARISNQAMPILKAEAISAQSAQVDIVSGATQISEAFPVTLGNALAQALR